ELPVGLGETFLGFLDLLLELGHVLATFVGQLAEALGMLTLFLELGFETRNLLARRGHGFRGNVGASRGIRERRFEPLPLSAELVVCWWPGPLSLSDVDRARALSARAGRGGGRVAGAIWGDR